MSDAQAIGVSIGFLGFFILIYLFNSYIQYRIGLKLGIKKGFGVYLIPLYPYCLYFKALGDSCANILLLLIPGINIIAFVILFGKIAEKLGRNFWLYGLGIMAFGLPILILAFTDKKN